MKVILYMAVSVNGFITDGEDGTDWVSKSDATEFSSLMKDCGVVVMGKRTFEFFGDDFPCEDAVNIVMTNQQQLLNKETSEKVIYTNRTPQEVLTMAEGLGFTKMMLIGGMALNTSFYMNGLIDEIWLSVHPVFIGDGKTVVDRHQITTELNLISTKELSDGLMQLRYSVKQFVRKSTHPAIKFF